MNLPLIVCLCCTYTRNEATKWLLEDACHSFLQQDYPNKALVILNDNAKQMISVQGDYPEITVVNWRKRFTYLSHKIAEGIRMASAQGSELFCRWDDDDLSAPHRLSYSYERLLRTPFKAHWSPRQHVYMSAYERPSITRDPANIHTASLFSLQTVKAMKGYPSQCNGNEDQVFDHRLRQTGLGWWEDIPAEDIFYFYRWGVSPTHLSAESDLTARYKSFLDKGKRRVLWIEPQQHTVLPTPAEYSASP